MVCPFCLFEKTEVYNSRSTKKLNSVWRRRRCPNCEHEFTTEEMAKPESIIRVGIKGLPRTLPYSSAKLLIALFLACNHKRDAARNAGYLLQTVEQRLYRLAASQKQIISKADIASIVLSVLKPYDTAAYIKYLSDHQTDIDDRTIRRSLKA